MSHKVEVKKTYPLPSESWEKGLEDTSNCCRRGWGLSWRKGELWGSRWVRVEGNLGQVFNPWHKGHLGPILCGGSCSVYFRIFIASLASSHRMPVLAILPTPGYIHKSCPQILQIPLGDKIASGGRNSEGTTTCPGLEVGDYHPFGCPQVVQTGVGLAELEVER